MAVDPNKIKARVDAMGRHVDQVMAGTIPVDAPAVGLDDLGVDDAGLPKWFGPDFHAGPDGAPGVTIDGAPV